MTIPKEQLTRLSNTIVQAALAGEDAVNTWGGEVQESKAKEECQRRGGLNDLINAIADKTARLNLRILAFKQPKG